MISSIKAPFTLLQKPVTIIGFYSVEPAHEKRSEQEQSKEFNHKKTQEIDGDQTAFFVGVEKKQVLIGELVDLQRKFLHLPEAK